MTYSEDPAVFEQAFDLYLGGKYQAAYDLLTTEANKYPQQTQQFL